MCHVCDDAYRAAEVSFASRGSVLTDAHRDAIADLVHRNPDVAARTFIPESIERDDDCPCKKKRAKRLE